MSQDIYTNFRTVRLCALPHSILLCSVDIACSDHHKSPNHNMSSSMISGDLGGHSVEVCCPVSCERSCLKPWPVVAKWGGILSCWNISVCSCADRMLSRQARSSISWVTLYQGPIYQNFCTACQHVCMNTGCFTTLGHNCRRWFPRSLWWKKFI